MIAAMGQNRVIGKDNDLVWSLPHDMKYFMETTKGHPIIMGRKNYESLPLKFRPLPGRTNIIVTRNHLYQDEKSEDCIIVTSIEEALKAARQNDAGEIFIIGGGQIYELGLPHADKLYLTEIEGSFDGDAFFPKFDKEEWVEVSRIHHPSDERHQYPFDFVIYQRNESIRK